MKEISKPHEQQIEFFAHEVSFVLENESSVKSWILKVIALHEKHLEGINFIFCSDEYLLELNRKHLQHDYYTDILTFPYSPPNTPILSDIYISIDRVEDNSKQLKSSFKEELHRVIIHGVLHLCGFDDHAEEDIIRMREMENEALKMLKA